MRNTAAEQELVDRMRHQDASAVADLAAAYGQRIYQLALRYMKNGEDAEEVAQDVLLKVYQKIDAFRGDAALSSWIYRITFNTAMSRLRSARLRSENRRPAENAAPDGERDRSALEVADWSSQADDEVMRGELRKKLIEAMTALPPLYRAAVLLRDVQGLSTEEASAILRVKPQTLKSRLHRGRLILRERLAEFASGVALHRTT